MSPSAAQAAQAAGAAPDEQEDEQENYYYTTFRQHIGFVLGALSIFLTYYTWDGEDPSSVWRMVGCLALCCVGLIFHELRPFKVSD